MKKFINFTALTLTGLVVAGIVMAWTNPTATPPGGSGAVTVNSSGNVGIGTVSPTSKLHLIGKIRIQDGTETAGDVLTSDSSGVASWAALAKGATFDHMDTWGVDDGIKSCTSIFSSLNTKSGLSGSSRTAVTSHATVFMATDGRWLFVANNAGSDGDCSPESNQPAGYGLIPRTSTGAAIPGYWSSKGTL